MRTPCLVAGLALLVLAAVCCALVKTTGVFPTGQPPVYTHAPSLTAFERELADLVRFLGRPAAAMGVVAVLVALCAATHAWRLIPVAVAAPLAALACDVIKTDIPPATPLPSGHAAYGTAVFGLAALVVVRRGPWPLALLPLAVALGMGPIRAIEGTHWWSDVIVGAALGAGWLLTLLGVVAALPARDLARATRWRAGGSQRRHGSSTPSP